MAVAQVSLVSAVKAAPVRASAGARRSARAVNVVAKAGVERFEVAKKAAPVALAVGTVMTATEARAAEVVAAVPQEVFATADITPVLYFGFLASSLTFACVTYVALSKIKLI
eukprot:CAMPEP_0203000710 /NCGR_PEP_ID=MMETSP1401-20130829/87_1 /ASSEMBLY_ACC=CAM_ASM_000894 /TAXON_ID=38833 /ORGANISM="Micromonas pusilla, Strain CCAC1681" /LENGTH=111 /DNA_ID=CAMNT_0049742163 /DNA_START=50 /DNA_END=385 /DNA_ORIENTATION=-